MHGVANHNGKLLSLTHQGCRHNSMVHYSCHTPAYFYDCQPVAHLTIGTCQVQHCAMIIDIICAHKCIELFVSNCLILTINKLSCIEIATAILSCHILWYDKLLHNYIFLKSSFDFTHKIRLLAKFEQKYFWKQLIKRFKDRCPRERFN